MIVVDTHALIWDALTPNRLSPQAQAALALANQQDGILIADISLWEIAMLIQRGRIQIATDCHAFLNLLLQANKSRVMPISPQIAAQSMQLPVTINKDPADRLIVATALVENVPLLTADHNLRAAAPVKIIW